MTEEMERNFLKIVKELEKTYRIVSLDGLLYNLNHYGMLFSENLSKENLLKLKENKVIEYFD